MKISEIPHFMTAVSSIHKKDKMQYQIVFKPPSQTGLTKQVQIAQRCIDEFNNLISIDPIDFLYHVSATSLHTGVWPNAETDNSA